MKIEDKYRNKLGEIVEVVFCANNKDMYSVRSITGFGYVVNSSGKCVDTCSYETCEGRRCPDTLSNRLKLDLVIPISRITLWD